MRKHIGWSSLIVLAGVLVGLGLWPTPHPATPVRAAPAAQTLPATNAPGPRLPGPAAVRVPGHGWVQPQPPGAGVRGTLAPPAPPVPAAPATCTTGSWSLKAPYPDPGGVGEEAVAAQGGMLYSFIGNTANYKYDPTSDTWTSIAGLPAGRSRASAVSDGTYLYILNGSSGNPTTNTLYRYDPVANSYTTLAPAPLATAEQAAVYLNGKIYRIAGYNAVSETATVDVYTISTDTWAPPGTVADYPLAVSGLSAIATGGYIYAAGGATQATVITKTYRYDPLSNTWDDNAIADLPTGSYEGAGDILNGRWVLAGGYADDYQLDKNVVALDLSNPSSPWVGLPWMPAWRWFAGGATVGSAFYIVGGYNGGFWLQGTTTVQQYLEAPCATTTPTVTGTAPTATRTGTVPPTPTPLACGTGAWQEGSAYPIPVAAAAAAMQGGVIYSFAGYANGVSVANAYKYDPVVGSWVAIAPLPIALSSLSVVSDGTYLYILNGFDLLGQTQHALYRYDPVANSYTTLTPAPLATWDQAAVYLGGKIYRVGGCTTPDNNSTTATVDVYTISTNTWAAPGTIAPYPIAAHGIAMLPYAGDLYGAGGSPHTGSVTTKTYRYDPIGNTWDDAAVTDLPQGRAFSATGLLNGRWLLAGGALTFLVPDNTAVALDLSNPAGGWASLPLLPAARAYLTGSSSGQTFYAIAGFDASIQPTTDTQQYTEAPCPATLTPTATQTPTATPTATTTPPATLTLTGTTTPTRLPSATPPGPSTTPPPTPVPPSRTAPPSVTPVLTATLGPSATPCALSFADVQAADYFYTPVRYLACHGVISGYSNGDGTVSFRPYTNTTRAQQVKIVVLGFALPIVTPPAGGYTFADVPPAHPFWSVIETAAARTIVSGYRCGGAGEPCDGAQRPYFRPYAAVTRGQLAKITVVAAGWALHTPPTATFADVAPGTAFYPFVETAACYGIVSGYSCGSAGEPCPGRYFRPANPAVRAQIAKLVDQALGPPAPCAGP